MESCPGVVPQWWYDRHGRRLRQPSPDTGQFFTRGNYAPVPDELTEYDLAVQGSIPPEIDGWYLRNGPNPGRPRATGSSATA